MSDVESEPIARSRRFVEPAGWVCDVSSPFSDDERHRDVWNEASSFGLQLALWLGALAATVAIWTVGAPALPYVVTLWVVLGLVSWLTIAYASALSVDVFGPTRLARPHTAAFVVVAVVFVAGCIVAGVGAQRASFGAGVAAGVGVVVAAAAVRRRVRRGVR